MQPELLVASGKCLVVSTAVWSPHSAAGWGCRCPEVVVQEAALSQGRKSKLSSSSFCVPNWWYFEKKTTQKKSLEGVCGGTGALLCSAVHCSMGWW